MSKQAKEVRKLRRELEILRAQLKATGAPAAPTVLPPATKATNLPNPVAAVAIDPAYIRTDLRRSLTITLGILITLAGLAISQPFWPKITNLVGQITP